MSDNPIPEEIQSVKDKSQVEDSNIKSKNDNQSISVRRKPETKSDKIQVALAQYEELLRTIMRSPSNSPRSRQSNVYSDSEEIEAKEETMENFEQEEVPVVVDIPELEFSTSSDLCAHKDVSKEKGIVTCNDCGMELYQDVSHEQDWRYFGDQDGRNNSDPSRCQYRRSPEKGIKKELEGKGFPPDICRLADQLYMEVTGGEVKRSELRKGIMFAVVFEAYKMLHKPRTPDDLVKRFGGIERKSLSQGLSFYRLRCPREYLSGEEISAKHYIPSILKKISKEAIKQEHIDKVVLIYEKIKDICPILNRSNPQSASKGLIYYYLRRQGCMISAVRYGKIVGLSDVIVLRISSSISATLGTSNIVKLL